MLLAKLGFGAAPAAAAASRHARMECFGCPDQNGAGCCNQRGKSLLMSILDEGAGLLHETPRLSAVQLAILNTR
jgi:hypothetical protein